MVRQYSMIASLDVQYTDTAAFAAAVVFDDWQAASARSTYIASECSPEPYEPGCFYLRELVPLLTVIDKIIEPVETFVIDGYCHLSDSRDPGLGAHLLERLGKSKTVIGVAKNRFRDTTHAVELLRGKSQRPLFITSIGIGYEDAAKHIASMNGAFRVPALLKMVDQLARQFAAQG